MEVAKDGVVRIPKTVFEPTPGGLLGDSGSGKSSNAGVIAPKVRRLDGTIQEVHAVGDTSNPNFAPRQTVHEYRVVTNDKMEVQLRFYERKGMPLTPELEAKKREMQAAGTYELREPSSSNGDGLGGKGKGKGKKSKGKQQQQQQQRAQQQAPRADADAIAKFKNRPKGGVKVLSGAEGSVTEHAAPPKLVVPKADADAVARFKNRPKGGVKVLAGVEGSVTGKRPLEP